MRPHAHSVHFVLRLVANPEVHELFGKDAALEQKFVIGAQRAERVFERAGQRRHLRGFLFFEFVKVLVERLAGVDLVLDAVEARHHHGCKSKIGVARWVRRAELKPPGLGALGINGDRKSTRLNSSHGYISYAVFCLKKKKKNYVYTIIHAMSATTCIITDDH